MKCIGDDSRSIMVWESTDLVNWGEGRLVKVAPPEAGNTRAPEAVWDPEQEVHLVHSPLCPLRDDRPRRRRVDPVHGATACPKTLPRRRTAGNRQRVRGAHQRLDLRPDRRRTRWRLRRLADRPYACRSFFA